MKEEEGTETEAMEKVGASITTTAGQI